MAVALGSTLATVVLAKDVALLEGLLAFVTFALLQWAAPKFFICSSVFRELVKSKPRLWVVNGVYRYQAMNAERVTVSELEAALQAAGVARPDHVGAVVLETDSSLSVIRRCDKGMNSPGYQCLPPSLKLDEAPR